MGDDEVRLCVLYELNDLVAALGVVGIDVKIIEHATNHFDSGQLSGLLRLVCAHGDEFVRRNHHVSEGSVAEMRNNNLVATLNALCERTCACDLNIIRMTANSQNVHLYSPWFI